MLCTEYDWQLFDAEGTGFIDAQDLWVSLAALGFEPREDEFKKIMTVLLMYTVCLLYTSPSPRDS